MLSDLAIYRSLLLTCLTLVLLQCTIVSAQPKIKLTNLSREHGLSNSTVFSIYQDSYGFMWFGSGAGLNRYDGAQMQVYRNNVKINHSISDDYIKCIYEDRRRNLWVGTTGGLNFFERNSGRFKRYYIQSSRQEKLGSDISCMLEDFHHNMWIGTHGSGLALLNKKTNKVIPLEKGYKNISLLNSRHINYLFEDTQHYLWIATDRGIVTIDTRTREFKSVNLPGKATVDVRTIKEDKRGNIWIATEGEGIYLYIKSAKKYTNFRHLEKNTSSLGSNLVRTLIIDDKGRVWAGCVTGGLNLFDPKTNSFHRYINDRTVSALFQDNQGNIWAGMHRDGVFLYAPKAQKFNLVQQQNAPHILNNNDVKSFFEDKQGNLWIGTDGGGLCKYDPETNRTIQYVHNAGNPKSLSSNFVLDIVGDERSNLWISSWGGGISLLDSKSGSFTRFLNTPDVNTSISSNYVQKMLPDSSGNFWVGTYFGGLNYFNIISKTFSRFVSDRKTRTAMWGNNVVTLCDDVKKGNLWIGTDDAGLNYYDKQANVFKHYFANEQSPREIRIIFKDRRNRIWVGAKGLYLYNRAKDIFELAKTASALNADFIKGILEDDRGILWISTLNGIVRFDPEKALSRRFNIADGLQNLEFEANAVLKTSKGEMFFGGINGYNHFDPKHIPTNNFTPPVYFTELYIFNKRILPQQKDSPLKADLPFTSKLNLTHRQSSFSVSFAALNYTSSKNNQYAYMLQGFEKDWNYVGNITRVSYTNLDPGNYILRVKAANNDGIWSKHIAVLPIYIKPPFWQELWFQLMIGAIAISIVYYVLSLKRKLELEKLEEIKKDEIHQMQLEFFTNISHEFRTPLALIMGRLERVIKENNNTLLLPHIRSLLKNSTHLLNLVNELMDFRKVESGILKLHVTKGNLSLFLDELADEFAVLAQEKNIVFSILKHQDLAEAWFDRQIMEKIITNLIYNSIKYTPSDGQITVELFNGLSKSPEHDNCLSISSEYKAKEYISIKIKDTGIGITKNSLALLFERYYRITDAHLGSGVGLAFVKSLTVLHKGQIAVSSERNEGTEIVISIPFLPSDYTIEEQKPEPAKTGIVNLESIIIEPEISILDQKAFPENGVESTSPKLHILLVEDNDEMRTMLEETLWPYYIVSTASNGKDALINIKEKFPDLVISDLMMEGMDGNALCKAVRNDHETSHIPFIMLTAKNALDSQITGMETGADFYFTKPVSIQLLLTTIKSIFSQRRNIKAHYVKGHQIELKEHVHSIKEKEFMDKIIAIIEKYMEDANFDAEQLCREIAMSKTNLYHKLKKITGHSIAEFIRTVRLNKAKDIMVNEDVMINEVMFRVGIQTQSYFTKVFKNEFGITPRQFLQEVKSKK